MTTYTFETISAAEALAFNSPYDSLTFTAPGSSAGSIVVVQDDSGWIRVAITSGVTGRTVVFGQYFGLEENITFPDGTTASVGHNFHANSLIGGAANDALFGGNGIDTAFGGAGSDTLVGGEGYDTLYGEAGADLFITYAGDSPADGFGNDQIWDLDPDDRLSFGPLTVTAANYAETTASSFFTARDAANVLIGAGTADVVVVSDGVGMYVFADSRQDNGVADDVVWVKGGLDVIDPSRFVSLPARPAFGLPVSTDPQRPPPPSVSYVYGGAITGDMDAVHVGSLAGAAIVTATSTALQLQGAQAGLGLTGAGFTYDASQQLTGGSITHVTFSAITASGPFSADVSLGAVSAAPFAQWVATDASQEAFAALLSGDENLLGTVNREVIHAYGGNDRIYGQGGSDALYGGDGNDQIFAGHPPNFGPGDELKAPSFLRGEAGDDYIVGDEAFDDIHGNMGNDTESGGLGDDWVVGGKDNDQLFGDDGADIVYGNMGDDICVGGDGADIVRGGQGQDALYGGGGNDWLSGDRGSDTLTGGAGADIFHAFGEAGLDRVLDFNAAEGDRVLLDPGSSYTVAQVGADTVIDVVGGAQVILAGVTLSALPAGWLVVGGDL